MPTRRGIFLTGSTGLLGQYLLRDLLLTDNQVTVLVRDSRKARAADRIGQIIAFWSDRLHRKLPSPTVLIGHLGDVGLNISRADRRWIGQNCRSVIHAAANLTFHENSDGEPWRTNVRGTQYLLALCQEVGLADIHHVSTAFICGRRTGAIAEDELDKDQSFHNAYEESKFQAEQLIRRFPGVKATIYRPAIIVGDTDTGYTSTFTGLYRFLEVGVRLAALNSAGDSSSLPLRLTLTGDEPWNLVPVDWVSRAIVEITGKPHCHGRTFHLVSRSPVATRLIRDIGAEILKIAGVEFAGPDGVENASRLEQVFLEGIQEYWPYLGGTPEFSDLNTWEALPDLPPPTVDRPFLERLIRFAAVNRWGRKRQNTIRAHRHPSVSLRCRTTLSRFSPGKLAVRDWQGKWGLISQFPST